MHFELPNCLQRLHLEYRNPAGKKVHNMVSKWCEIHHNLWKYTFPWNHNVEKFIILCHTFFFENVDFTEFLINNGASGIFNVENTVWKFHDFSLTQILDEINFGEFWSSVIAISAILGALKSDFMKFSLFGGWNIPN